MPFGLTQGQISRIWPFLIALGLEIFGLAFWLFFGGPSVRPGASLSLYLGGGGLEVGHGLELDSPPIRFRTLSSK